MNDASGAAATAAEKPTDDCTKQKEKVTADPVDPEPHRIRIMSWNIDGLDTNNLRNRTKGVCATVNKYV